jgi:hypothetical protein
MTELFAHSTQHHACIFVQIEGWGWGGGRRRFDTAFERASGSHMIITRLFVFYLPNDTLLFHNCDF